MTDNEKNKAIHEWLGNCYHTLIPSGKVTMSGFEVMRCSQCNKHESFCEPCPDYLHDNVAAVSLLDVLKKKYPQAEPNLFWSVTGQHQRFALDAQCYYTYGAIIREAICEAILQSIKKEEGK